MRLKSLNINKDAKIYTRATTVNFDGLDILFLLGFVMIIMMIVYMLLTILLRPLQWVT